MTKARRLLYLTLETPREGQASHTHIHAIAEGLRARGWHVDLAATSKGGAASGSPLILRLIEQLWLQFKLLPRLRNYDALYLRAHVLAWPLAMVARLLRVPLVQEVNGQPADLAVTYPRLKPLSRLIHALYVSQFRAASHIVAVTDGLAQWVRSVAGHLRVTALGNGADTTLFTPLGPIQPNPFRSVVFVGGLVKWHGIATMLRALDDPAWPPEIKLVMIGDGPEAASVKAAASHPRLLWLGRLPQSDIPAHIRAALAGLCIISDPAGRSSTGVLPLKLFETLACGVPIIASDLPGQADIVRNAGCGLIIPPDNPTALATSVATLAQDPAEGKAMGLRGAAYVKGSASWQAIAERTNTILQEAIAAGGRR